MCSESSRHLAPTIAQNSAVVHRLIYSSYVNLEGQPSSVCLTASLPTYPPIDLARLLQILQNHPKAPDQRHDKTQGRAGRESGVVWTTAKTSRTQYAEATLGEPIRRLNCLSPESKFHCPKSFPIRIQSSREGEAASMEVLLFFGGVWLLFWLGPRIYGFFNPPTQRPTWTPSPSTDRVSPKPDPAKYRPRPPSKNPKVQFGPASPSPAPDIKDLHDAFTGAPLNPALGLYQCTNCQVYYHSESFVVLREENAGRCVACGSNTVVARGAQEASAGRGRDYDPNVVTLANFRSHFDRVVTFEGLVRDIKVSKRGKDYAVMFEQASWSKGLKLVFFRRSIPDAGGVAFIKSLRGRHVRVRGLLINHRFFGPEIIITERNMILDVR